jgi:hypothetical protein
MRTNESGEAGKDVYSLTSIARRQSVFGRVCYEHVTIRRVVRSFGRMTSSSASRRDWTKSTASCCCLRLPFHYIIARGGQTLLRLWQKRRLAGQGDKMHGIRRYEIQSDVRLASQAPQNTTGLHALIEHGNARPFSASSDGDARFSYSRSNTS